MFGRSASRRLVFDAVVALAGLVYLICALVFQLNSPVVGAAIVIFAGHELIRPRRAGKPPRLNLQQNGTDRQSRRLPERERV
jgi:hypothetical protein